MSRLYLIVFFHLLACNENAVIPLETPTDSSAYFPPIQSEQWETIPPESLNWDMDALQDLYDFHEENGSRAFIILKDGRIVVEKYWGNNIIDNAPFGSNTLWYWASAGKTITAFLTGIAQQNNLLSINDKTSDYLGVGWTSMPAEKEDLITIKHQLSMTTGLDYDVMNVNCTEPSCLTYKTNAGQQWFYHNAPYTLIQSVIANASNQSYNAFTNIELESKIGMSGSWMRTGDNTVYWSKPRDMARFGLLILNEGKWKDERLLTDMSFFQEMVNSSQRLNPSYGYLWWLNGKESIILPGISTSFYREAIPNAPEDMFSGIGKNGQIVDVIPSKKMVVIRMGEAPSNHAVPLEFLNEMWNQLNQIMN